MTDSQVDRVKVKGFNHNLLKLEYNQNKRLAKESDFVVTPDNQKANYDYQKKFQFSVTEEEPKHMLMASVRGDISFSAYPDDASSQQSHRD